MSKIFSGQLKLDIEAAGTQFVGNSENSSSFQTASPCWPKVLPIVTSWNMVQLSPIIAEESTTIKPW